MLQSIHEHVRLIDEHGINTRQSGWRHVGLFRNIEQHDTKWLDACLDSTYLIIAPMMSSGELTPPWVGWFASLTRRMFPIMFYAATGPDVGGTMYYNGERYMSVREFTSFIKEKFDELVTLNRTGNLTASIDAEIQLIRIVSDDIRSRLSPATRLVPMWGVEIQ